MESDNGRETVDSRDEVLSEGLAQPPEQATEQKIEKEVEKEAEKEVAMDVENVNDWADDSASPTERVASSAREQASAAADALRRGEFMRDAAVDPEANSDDRLIALLCYVTQMVIPLVMPVLVLMSESSKKRPFQRFHAVQSLALVSLFVLVSLLVTIGTAIISVIPVVGWLIGLTVLCLSPIAVLMGYFAVGYYGFQSYQGKCFGIPGLTSFLRDQGWI
ncbi:MAG: hypothetical protein WAU10_10500 [Caldilineaceae bacterium]